MDMGCFRVLVHCGACVFSNWSFPGGSGVKNLPAMQEPQETWVHRFSAFWLRSSAGNAGSIPGSGRFPGGWHCNPLQYSCLENSMDREDWRTIVHRVTKSQTQLKLVCTHTCFPIKIFFLFFLNMYPGVGLLNHMVTPFLVF